MIQKSCDVLPIIFSRRVAPENPRNGFSRCRTWTEQKNNENDKVHKHYFISTEALILFIHCNQWGNSVLFRPPDDWLLLQPIGIRMFSLAQWSSQWERSGGGDRVAGSSAHTCQRCRKPLLKLSWALCSRSFLESCNYFLKNSGVSDRYSEWRASETVDCYLKRSGEIHCHDWL